MSVQMQRCMLRYRSECVLVMCVCMYLCMHVCIHMHLSLQKRVPPEITKDT